MKQTKNVNEIEIMGTGKVTIYHLNHPRPISRIGIDLDNVALIVEYTEYQKGYLLNPHEKDACLSIGNDSFREVCSDTVNVYKHSLIGSLTGSFEHDVGGWRLCGSYSENRSIKELNENLLERLRDSQLPDKVKKAMGIEV